MTDRFTFFLGKDRMEWLKAEAKRQGIRTVAEMLRRIVDEYRKEKK